MKSGKNTGPSPAELNPLIALYNARRYAELESRARVLTGQYPASGFAWKLLGAALQMQGKNALAAFQKATALMPADAEAQFNLGVAQKSLGLLNEAVISYRRALKLNPGFAPAYDNLGNALRESGQLDEALACYRKVTALKPNSADAHHNLGMALKNLGQFDGAAASYRRALAIKPDYAAAHKNLGSVLASLGQIDEALDSYQRALALEPDYAEQSSRLFIMNYADSRTPAYRLEEARQYGRMVSQKITGRFSAWLAESHPRRLRVGMISGDLYNHPVGYFLESLLAHIDPARIELIAYPTNPVTDALTARIKPYFSAWRSLVGIGDEAAAHLIHGDGVHVLLDLSGHTRDSGLPIFAWKPAPVQAAWLGYFATTGVSEMDYLIADQTGVPEEHRGHFSETVWYLPDTRLCFSPPETALPVAPLPALTNGHITFGCFQNLPKVGDEVLATWASILAALPGSRLRLQCKQLGEAAVAERMVQRLRQQGIDPSRVALHGAASRESYLAAHAGVDMLLDTFPYPGGTTTCEALWMGVPTLTLAGDTLLSRQGASLLTAAGLADWVATSREDYINKAVAFAGEVPKLAALRNVLREQVRISPLFDAPRFARHLEDALWGMWQAYNTQGQHT